jgi:uncharacterized protein YjdB
VGGATTSAQLTASGATGGTWFSNNTAVATVSATGFVTAVAAGTATIRYVVTNTGACGANDTASFVVTVSQRQLAGTITGTSALCVGGATTSAQLTASGATGGTWFSNNTAVATVSATGFVTALAAGTAAIRYVVTNTGACGANDTASFVVTVSQNPVTGTISGSSIVCLSGSTTSAQLTFTGGTTGGIWSSSNSSVATVNATTGLVTALSVGSVTINYTVAAAGGCSDATTSFSISVVTQLNTGLLSGNQSLCNGSTSTYTSTVLGGFWTSSNVAIATIDSFTGVATTLSSGAVKFYYTVNATGSCPSATDSILVTINPFPNLVVQSPSPVCQPGSVNLTSSSVTLGSDTGLIYSYWLDSSASVALVNPNVVTLSGTYYIRGLNPTTGCSIILPVNVVIRPIDTVVVDTSICSPSIFVVGTQQFAVTGNYQVRLTNSFGCDSMVFVRLTVFNNAVALIGSLGSTVFCVGDSVVLRSNIGSGLSFQWLLNVASIPGATSNTLTARDSGQYQIVVTFGNSCTDTSAILSVTVNPIPNAVISLSGTTNICSGSSLQLTASAVPGATYTWYRNGFPIFNQTSRFLTVTGPGDYYFRVATSTCDDFSDTLTVTVSPRPTSNIAAAGPTSFCQGSSVTLNAAQFPGSSVVWLLNGVPIPGATNFALNATLSGLYRAVLSIGACSDTSGSISVNVLPVPVATITVIGDTNFCEGNFVRLSAPLVQGVSYTWLNNGIPVLGQYGSFLIVRASGVFQVVMTNPFGCSDTSAGQITIMRPRPSAPIISLNSTGDSLISTATLGNQWYYNGFPITGATGQAIAVTANGLYFSIVTGSNGCPSDTSNIINLNNVGLDEEEGISLRMYPNPTNGETWIEFELPGVADINLEITNVAGSLVRSFSFNRVESGSKYLLDLRDVAEGVYFTNIRSDNSVSSKKLIIAR